MERDGGRGGVGESKFLTQRTGSEWTRVVDGTVVVAVSRKAGPSPGLTPGSE